MRDAVKLVYGRLPNDHVRIQILSNRPELQALPWEYIWQRGATRFGPDRQRSIVRIVPIVGKAPPKPKKLEGQKLRILFAAADPVDEEPVSWQDSRKRIEDVFGRRIKDGFDLEPVEAANRQSLADALDDAEADFDIFHFSGHGMIDKKGVGHLVLSDAQGNKAPPIDAEDLADLLTGRGIRLVVLSACETSTGDFSRPFAVISETLVHEGIPAVVANQLPIPDHTMAVFVGALYNRLLRTGDIDEAMTEGRMRLKHELGGLEWGIPTLHRHVNAAKLFEPKQDKP